MSTTTIGDLLDRAEHQARALRRASDPTTLATWERFGATTTRLLREDDGRRGLRLIHGQDEGLRAAHARPSTGGPLRRVGDRC